MSKPTAKHRAATRPPLAPLPDGERLVGSPDDLWRQGEDLEAAYDFEAARLRYLAAARAATGARWLDYVSKYAEFLVERFGQFDEVARWLDDPAFEAPLEVPGSTAEALARHVARAAHETSHPRAAGIDEVLAAQGDLAAIQRTAQRLAQQGDKAAARALLEPQAQRLAPGSTGGQLLSQLRHEEQERWQAAQAPVEVALQAGDLAGARQVLDQLRTRFPQHPGLYAIDARLQEAERQTLASGLRQRLEQALDAQDLDLALQTVQALVALPVATEADRNYLTYVQGQVQARDQAALTARARAAQGRERLALLGTIADRFGAEVSIPTELSDEWSAVREVHALPRFGTLAEAAEGLQTLLDLRQVLAGGDPDEVRPALEQLPGGWSMAPTAQKARTLLRKHEETLAEAEQAALVEAVQTLLDLGQVDEAETALQGWTERGRAITREISSLRTDVQVVRQQAERRRKLTEDFDKKLNTGALFEARALLGDLQHLLPMAETEALRTRLEAEMSAKLRGKPVPPGMQKFSQEPLAAGVAHGRLVVVQGGIWLTVNLETFGLQPFALPADWPVRADTGVRIGQVGDRIRLTGLSKQRLVVYEQVPGQAPVLTAAADLAELIKGDDLLIGRAIEPGADRWALLSRSSRRGPASSWTRVDPATLEVAETRRPDPPLTSLVAIEGLPDAVLVATLPRERNRFAVAVTDLRGEPIQRFSQEDLGEWVASFRQAFAWPKQERLYARFDTLDPFDPTVARAEPSLLVVRGLQSGGQARVQFASTDLRRRFAPLERLALDHAWTLDPVAGRLWFAALPTGEDGPKDALLLGVDAKTLRADKPMRLEGVERVLSLLPVPDGAVALSRLAGGGYALVRARTSPAGLELSTHKLPL